MAKQESARERQGSHRQGRRSSRHLRRAAAPLWGFSINLRSQVQATVSDFYEAYAYEAAVARIFHGQQHDKND